MYKKIIFILVGISLVFIGCSSDKVPTPSTSHPETWTEVGNADFHGTKVLTSGLVSCKSCHGNDFMGGESKVSCYSCHESYPHTDVWNALGSDNNHGAYIVDNDWDLDDCSRCHGMDYEGGKSDISCYSCHDSYPHFPTWTLSESELFHGKYLKAHDYAVGNCQSCHGQDYSGGTSETSCYQCHANYPHMDTWMGTTDASHGSFILADENNIQSCESCHGSDYGGGTSDVSCYTCHQTYPHFASWNEPESEQFHGKYVESANWNVESCESCHGDDYSGGTSNVSCYTCHQSFPHNDSWLTATEDGHGAFLKNVNWAVESCTTCHGEDLAGGSSDISCYTCHENYPHDSEWMNMASNDSHGSYVKAQEWDTESCQTCHGEDLAGGTSDVSCYTCHESYPHADTWLTATEEGHGAFVKALEWDLESCADCHGEDYKGGSSEVSCYTCHESYPHPENHEWVGGTDVSHGKYIKTQYWDLSSCQLCHGEDYAGGTTNTSCTTCHSGEQGPESCNVCHGSGFNAAPPQDLADHSETTYLGVGAHQTHMAVSPYCELCHHQPESFDDPLHLDGNLPAEVNENLQWNRETATCANVYCHSDENRDYTWN